MGRVRSILAAARDELNPGGVVAGLLLTAIVIAGLWLRLKNNGYGLPYVYNYDEANHFTDKAVTMLSSGSLNPDYFQNPSGFTYLVYAALRIKYGLVGFLFDLPEDTIIRQFRINAGPIWETARAVATLLAMTGILVTYYVTKKLWGVREALVAAAILTFAFLSVVYSRIALTDVGTFIPIAIAIYGSVRVFETGERRWYLLSGAAVGLAIGFKYTSGLVVLPLMFAAVVRLWPERRSILKHPELRSATGSAITALITFGLTSPFVYLKPREAGYQLKTQASEAGDVGKIGQAQDSAVGYYLDSLTWGLGYVLMAAAVLGFVLMFRRDRMRALLVVMFPVVLFAYMSMQSRYFGRWLLPSYPALAMLAAYGLTRLSELASPGKPTSRALALAGLAAIALAQPIAADVRSMRVLGKEDTRQLARDYLTDNYAPGLRIVVEPGVPDDYYRLRPGIKCRPGDFSKECLPRRRKQFIRGFVKDLRSSIALGNPDGSQNYVRTLRPEHIQAYREQGFCLVMTLSVIRGRAENDGIEPALDYYERLDRESIRVFTASPYDNGAKAVPFHFDLSYNYYPTEFERPGPYVNIYELIGCRQQYGRVPEHPQGTRGLEKGMGSSITTPD